jgi:hypothetical protein
MVCSAGLHCGNFVCGSGGGKDSGDVEQARFRQARTSKTNTAGASMNEKAIGRFEIERVVQGTPSCEKMNHSEFFKASRREPVMKVSGMAANVSHPTFLGSSMVGETDA